MRFAGGGSRFAPTREAAPGDGGSAPSTYVPGAGASAGRSFNAKSRAGIGGFGVTSKRTTTKPVEARPGPGDYEAAAANPRGAVATPSAAFASKSAKALSHASDAPAANAYDAHLPSSISAVAAKSVSARAGGPFRGNGCHTCCRSVGAPRRRRVTRAPRQTPPADAERPSSVL